MLDGVVGGVNNFLSYHSSLALRPFGGRGGAQINYLIVRIQIGSGIGTGHQIYTSKIELEVKRVYNLYLL